MTNRWSFGAGFAALAAGAAALLTMGAPAAATPETEANGRLNTLIQQSIREGGPFFTAEERAVIERECGYAPGSWDGFEANMSDGVFHCTNGRRVDSAEMRAVMEAAGPRIGARVSRAMARPEVTEAISRVAAEASEAALRNIDVEAIAREAALAVDYGEIGREAAREAQEAVAEAMRALEETQRERRGRR